MIVGIIFFVTIGFELLPDNAANEDADSIYSQEKSYDDIPEWKGWVSLIVLIFTVLAMVFEKKIGIKLFVSAWIGALVLVVTRVISSSDAIKSIDMNTILLYVGSLALASALKETGTGDLIANTIVSKLGDNPSPTALMIIIFYNLRNTYKLYVKHSDYCPYGSNFNFRITGNWCRPKSSPNGNSNWWIHGLRNANRNAS